MSGRGWLHNEEHRYVLIEDTSAKGKKYIEVYQKVGTIFNNDQREEGSKKPLSLANPKTANLVLLAG